MSARSDLRGVSLSELRAQSPIDRSSRSLPHVYVLGRRCRLSPDHAIAAIAPSDRRRQRWNNWSPWPRVAPRLAKSRSWVHSWLIMFCYRREAVIACPSRGYLFCHTENDEIEMAGDPAPGKSLATFADSARCKLRGVVCATTATRRGAHRSSAWPRPFVLEAPLWRLRGRDRTDTESRRETLEEIE